MFYSHVAVWIGLLVVDVAVGLICFFNVSFLLGTSLETELVEDEGDGEGD